jgi:hypothetical protein
MQLTDERHGETGGLFGLAGDVARDERDDHIALREEELGAVEGDEQACGVGGCGFDADDDSGADYRWDRPELRLNGSALVHSFNHGFVLFFSLGVTVCSLT